MWRPPSRGFGRAALIVAAAAAAVVPLPAPLIEHAYSTVLFPRLQRLVTSASNLAPFALVDALIVVTLAAWIIAIGIDIARTHRGWRHVVARLMLRTIVWTAAFYLAFLVLWGFNYRRVRLADKLQFDPRAISPDALIAVGSVTVAELNALHERAHETGWPERGTIDSSLAAGFDRVQRELGVRMSAVAARPKLTLLDPYFRRAGVAGMTDPYFLETLAESDLLPFERPFVVAHEWAHLAGFADESEANFVGWLTCLRGSIPDRYSGWLFLYEEISRAVARSGRAGLAGKLGSGPRADLRAIADRLWRDVNPTVSVAGWGVYDKYLKANRVQAGAASYAEVVRLILGARFGPDWTPQLR